MTQPSRLGQTRLDQAPLNPRTTLQPTHTAHHTATTDGWQGELSLVFDYSPTVPVSSVSNASAPSDSSGASDVGHSPSTLQKTGTTRLVQSRAIAPLKVQRPFYPEGDRVCHSVIVHTAGGMVGGDGLDLTLDLAPDAHALVTTAAASKAYKSNGPKVHQTLHMTVEAGGCLEWLPQPLIVFNGAHYQQTLRVDLAPGAMWIGWDIARLGRTVRGERFEDGVWRSRLEVWQDNRPLWIDPQWIQGAIQAGIHDGSDMLTSAHGLNHCPVIGTFALVGVDVSDDIIALARKTRVPMTPNHSSASIGVSQLQSGLVCRYRGHSTIEVQRWFMQVWHLVRQTYLARPSCIPRVWQCRP